MFGERSILATLVCAASVSFERPLCPAFRFVKLRHR
jgi:hypothetical protein